MTLWWTYRSWAAVHASRPGLAAMAAAAVAALILGRTVVEDLGVIRLIAPVSVLLLLPAVTGVAAALACENTAKLPLPDPPRAVLSRALWAMSWTLLAVVTVNLGQLTEPSVDWTAITRNVLLQNSIGLAVVAIGQAQLVWLPPFTYTVACMLFGHSESGFIYYWWAVIMVDHVTVNQYIVATTLYLGALISYVIGPHWKACAKRHSWDRAAANDAAKSIAPPAGP